MTALRLALLTVLGLGRIRPAPGTWGSAAAVVLVLGVLAAGATPTVVNVVLLVTMVIFSLSCIIDGGWAEQRFGDKDPGQVVADETAGQALAMMLLPWSAGPDAWPRNLLLAGTAFAAFRFFDILKPPPIRRVQRVGGGWGILLDDLLAGAAALAVTQTVAWLTAPAVV